jgi:ABC-type taurine transport system ATPase subunit
MGPAHEHLIELAAVTLSYPDGAGRPHEVLRGLDLHVEEGELLCVLGPSGCGKSTLLNLVAGFLRPAAGTVRFAGREVIGPGPDRGVVFQDPTLFPWLTTQGNVEFGLRAAPVTAR